MKLLVYRINDFGAEKQRRLRRVCDKLSERGCQVLISNYATPFIRDLYNDSRYEVSEVKLIP